MNEDVKKYIEYVTLLGDRKLPVERVGEFLSDYNCYTEKERSNLAPLIQDNLNIFTEYFNKIGIDCTEHDIYVGDYESNDLEKKHDFPNHKILIGDLTLISQNGNFSIDDFKLPEVVVGSLSISGVVQSENAKYKNSLKKIIDSHFSIINKSKLTSLKQIDSNYTKIVSSEMPNLKSITGYTSIENSAILPNLKSLDGDLMIEGKAILPNLELINGDFNFQRAGKCDLSSLKVVKTIELDVCNHDLKSSILQNLIKADFIDFRYLKEIPNQLVYLKEANFEQGQVMPEKSEEPRPITDIKNLKFIDKITIRDKNETKTNISFYEFNQCIEKNKENLADAKRTSEKHKNDLSKKEEFSNKMVEEFGW